MIKLTRRNVSIKENMKTNSLFSSIPFTHYLHAPTQAHGLHCCNSIVCVNENRQNVISDIGGWFGVWFDVNKTKLARLCICIEHRHRHQRQKWIVVENDCHEDIIRLCNQVKNCEWQINDRSKCFGRRQGYFLFGNWNFHFVCAKLILPLLVLLLAGVCVSVRLYFFLFDSVAWRRKSLVDF